MLAKCANPACSATFHYLHEGRLFAFEVKPDAALRGPPADPDYVGRSHGPQYFWLCGSCCSAMTLQANGDHGVTVVRKRGVPQNVGIEVAHETASKSWGRIRGLAVQEVHMKREREKTLEVLKNELKFVENGGYRIPLVWRAVLVFEDSPLCPKDPCRACLDANCVLVNFVPTECRDEIIPCRHIPLNETGETLNSLYRTATNEEIEQTVESWLLKTIQRLEEPSGPTEERVEQPRPREAA